MNFIYKFIAKKCKEDYWTMNSLFCWYFRKSSRIYSLLKNEKRLHPVFGKFKISRTDSITDEEISITFDCGWISIYSSVGFMNSSECKSIKVCHKEVYEYNYNDYTNRVYKKGFMNFIGNRIINKALNEIQSKEEDLERILEQQKCKRWLMENL